MVGQDPQRSIRRAVVVNDIPVHETVVMTEEKRQHEFVIPALGVKMDGSSRHGGMAIILMCRPISSALFV
jgi:hypothetical protein